MSANRRHTDIVNTWTKIRHAKAFKEWINADIGCYLVQQQFEAVILAMAKILNTENCSLLFNNCNSMIDTLDHLFNTMNLMWSNTCNIVDIHVHATNFIERQQELYCNLVRLSYMVI